MSFMKNVLMITVFLTGAVGGSMLIGTLTRGGGGGRRREEGSLYYAFFVA